MEATVTGSLPAGQVDFDELFFNAEKIMLASVRQNFAVGGRPNVWAPLAQTGYPSHLMQTGGLVEAIGSTHGPDFAEVMVGGIPYARILQEGGTIQHPGSDKLQVFQIGGKWIYTKGTRPHTIFIPPRPYMMFQEEDIVQINEMFGEKIVYMINSKQEMYP